MRNIQKLILNFLSHQDRTRLAGDLKLLSKLDNSTYIELQYRQDVLDTLTRLTQFTEPLILQIVAHGNCDGFGRDSTEYIYYNEISDTLRQINQATQNRLILNLITVCCSKYQLEFFNQGNIKLYRMLIACAKGAFVHSAILHPIDINNTPMANLSTRIGQINEDLDDNYSHERPETQTYFISN